MNRITEAERERFHNILDDSIDKLDSPKNSKKTHWKHCSIFYLKKRGREEKQELKESLEYNLVDTEILSECYDNINFSLMIADNLSRKKLLKRERKAVLKKAVILMIRQHQRLQG